MRTLFLTGYDDAFAPIGELTTPVMREYAELHDFEFICMTDGPKECHPSWWKMSYLLSGLNFYDRVIWMDADILITNPYLVHPSYSVLDDSNQSGYHCSRDWGQDATEPWMLSNCCFTAFPDSLPLIRWVLENKDNYSCEFHEQNHMREAALDKFNDVITVHPSRTFAAVPIEIHPSVVDPWQPGDWCAHLTMVDLKERVRLFHEIKKQAMIQ